jgi:hypothetical protein
LLSALVVAHTAAADGSEASATPLTGETLSAAETSVGDVSTVSGTCNVLGTSTFEFLVSGVATGPYPGTFTEEGTLSLNLAGFEPVAFNSTFTITSMAGTVTGSKTRTDAIVPPVFAACTEAGVADAFSFEGNVTYIAEITTSEGTASDNGEGRVDYSDTQIRGVAGFNGFNFVETFVSTTGGDGDDDDDGGGSGDEDD